MSDANLSADQEDDPRILDLAGRPLVGGGLDEQAGEAEEDRRAVQERSGGDV